MVTILYCIVAMVTILYSCYGLNVQCPISGEVQGMTLKSYVWVEMVG